MFVGHFAVAFAAKCAAPRTSLGTLTAAAQLLDLIWPFLVIAGVERVRIQPGITAASPLDFISYPWSHSLVMASVWGGIMAAIYWTITRYKRGAVVIGLAVVSHWVLDAISHRPDLPLVPGVGTYVGLGLWKSIPATLIVEAIMFIAGVLLYATGTRSRDRIGTVGLWGYVAVLGVLYTANAFGPAPPNAQAVAISALGMFLLVLWASWVDRHRVPYSKA
jgi:membrane-bound metal-dependent hydrolase YbcI (DUF457 family)